MNWLTVCSVRQHIVFFVLRRRPAGAGLDARARTVLEFTADQRVGRFAVIIGLCHQMCPEALVAVKVAVATRASNNGDGSDWSTEQAYRLITIEPDQVFERGNGIKSRIIKIYRYSVCATNELSIVSAVTWSLGKHITPVLQRPRNDQRTEEAYRLPDDLCGLGRVSVAFTINADHRLSNHRLTLSANCIYWTE